MAKDSIINMVKKELEILPLLDGLTIIEIETVLANVLSKAKGSASCKIVASKIKQDADAYIDAIEDNVN